MRDTQIALSSIKFTPAGPANQGRGYLSKHAATRAGGPGCLQPDMALRLAVAMDEQFAGATRRVTAAADEPDWPAQRNQARTVGR